MSQLGTFVWGIADALRGPYKPHQYGDVILPMTILRRLDALLGPTRDGVAKVIDDSTSVEVAAARIKQQFGLHFFNTSQWTLAKLLGDPDGLAHELLSKIRHGVKGAEALDLDFHTVGFRPTPADGFSAVGRPKGPSGLYIAVTHSGITLAPAIGLFAAQELMEHQRDSLLDPFHPDRPSLS